MQKDDFQTALNESEDLLRAAQPEELEASNRFVACQVAYARRQHEYLPIEEINQWIEAERKDLTKREVVTEGMERVIEVLRFLDVEPVRKSVI